MRWLCLGLALLCCGCSAIAADAQHADGKRFKGTLMILAVDNFKDRISQTRYSLSLDGDKKVVALRFADQHRIPDLKSGMRVEVLGQKLNSHIDVQEITVLSE